MALKTFEPDQIIYQEGTPVNEIAIIIKGHVRMTVSHFHIQLKSGNIMGVDEEFGSNHFYNYTADDEVTIYTYTVHESEDIVHMIDENAKLAPTITQRVLAHTIEIYKLTKAVHNKAKDEYKRVHANLHEYPLLCAKTGLKAQDFSHLSEIENPAIPLAVTPWKSDFIHSFLDNDATLQQIYTQDIRSCIGLIMSSVEVMREITADLKEIVLSLNEFQRETNTFNMTIETLESSAKAITDGDMEMDMPPMENILSQVLLFAKADEAESSQIRDTIDQYLAIPDRNDTSDKVRKIRRSFTEQYYTLYKKAFLESLNETEISPVIRMFFLYGLIDERLVEKKDLEILYGQMQAMQDDPDGRILPLYDWLYKIYRMETEPSINEFQQDFQAYLRECKTNGEMSADEIEAAKDDPLFRLDYELKNLFMIGNRMTFARMSIYQPAFDSSSVIMPLDKTYSSITRIKGEFDRIRMLDYQCFYRDKIFVHPRNESIQFRIHEEQLPHVILMPLVGSHMVLWQCIEGRKRNTPARMLIPIFFENDFTDHFTQLCGDFRWEMCKTEQGARWTDITDPSLTAEYNDYLQFYRKNSQLSAEHKEKVRALLKKHANNFKKIFIADYLSYIKYESAGNMRLMKYPREIIFKYCAFKNETRERLMSAPQYEKLINLRNTKVEQAVHPMDVVLKKAASKGEDELPELIEEIAFLRS